MNTKSRNGPWTVYKYRGFSITGYRGAWRVYTVTAGSDRNEYSLAMPGIYISLAAARAAINRR